MEIQDMVKLIYQCEFGGGHLISDPQESLRRLKAEFENRERRIPGVKSKKGVWAFVESVGHGMCRISLEILNNGLSPWTLNRMFVLSAAETKGCVEGFEQGLKLFKQLCEERKLPYRVEEVEAYLKKYKDSGYPPVSHSERYREAYNPSYRIVDRLYVTYMELFIAMDKFLYETGEWIGLSGDGVKTDVEGTSGNSVKTAAEGTNGSGVKTDVEGTSVSGVRAVVGGKCGKSIKVAIDGMSGSGKSTLAKLLSGVYSCNLFHMDDFFLQPWQRTRERLEEAGGNVDYERFKSEILDKIDNPDGLEYQIYDCGQQRLDRKVRVPGQIVNIVEGSYSQQPYFGDCYDLRVFLEVKEEEQRKRILERNGELMFRRFVFEWIPMENKYFREFAIKENSDLVFGYES